MNISIYKNIRQTKGGIELNLYTFLDHVKEGRWQDKVLKVRTTEGDEKKKNKLNLPYVTISGTFEPRSNTGLIEHSGFIAIDIDNLGKDLDNAKEVLTTDPYTHSIFTSCGGAGLCIIVKIDGKKHIEAFTGLEEYYFKQYQIAIDTSCKDVSRPRFVSFDPDLVINENSKKFNYYPKKTAPKKIPNIVFNDTDIDFCVKQIAANSVDITGGYQQWLQIGFALASHLGDSGRDYYHTISQYGSSYDTKLTDKQYDKCVKGKREGVTIATFFYYCKQSGIQTTTDKTKKIAQVAKHAIRGKQDQAGAAETLSKIHNIPAEESKQVIEQVFKNPSTVKTGDENISVIEEIELYLSSNYYDIKFNEITRRLTRKNVVLDERKMNDIWRHASKAIESNVKFEHIKRVLFSDFVSEYNPIIDFFEKNSHRHPKGLIDKLSECIDTPTGYEENNFYPDYAKTFIKSWLVGCISMIHGQHSPLCLMLVGHKQGTGKTEFFRRLLPDELKNYYAESKLDKGKDDEILMCEKMIILNDEYEGRTVDNEKQMKQLLSTQSFTLRAPYGMFSERRNRIAALAATANEETVLKDPTGNRRFIPIKVNSIDFEKYNKIDKIDLWLEVYHLYKSGYDWEVKGELRELLNGNTEQFDDASIEAELISKYFKVPSNNDNCQYLTTSEIKVYIENNTNQRLSKRKIGLELKALGFENKQKKINGSNQRRWFVIQI